MNVCRIFIIYTNVNNLSIYYVNAVHLGNTSIDLYMYLQEQSRATQFFYIHQAGFVFLWIVLQWSFRSLFWLTMRCGCCSLLTIVRWPIVVNLCVIWSLVESCHILIFIETVGLYYLKNIPLLFEEYTVDVNGYFWQV